jgi:hypothetical protein
MPSSRRSLSVVAALAGGALVAGCVAEVAAPPADGDGMIEPHAQTPDRLNIGFNGDASEFAFHPDWDAATVVQPGARVCHTYISWDVAYQAPQQGSAGDESSRAYLDSWLSGAAGHCDEVFLAFKSMTPRAAVDEVAYTDAFAAFVATDWEAETGYAGAFSFSTWNEPNNPGVAGNGLGVQIEAGLAARYYLNAEALCRAYGCRVAAGDFASNGAMWNDFEWNCANDNVATADLCSADSSENRGGLPASYLDRYKNEIAQHANDAPYDLGDGFRPESFAYHGWHDTNGYLYYQQKCTGYDDCAVWRLLTSLGGSWGGVKLWDTEDGMGQDGALTDAAQACGAAYLVRTATTSDRIERALVTRLNGGAVQLELDDHSERPAFGVLARRETTYAASCF